MARKSFLGVVVLVLLALTSPAVLAFDFVNFCMTANPKQIQAAIDRGEMVTNDAFVWAVNHNPYPQSWAVLIEAGKEYDLDLLLNLFLLLKATLFHEKK